MTRCTPLLLALLLGCRAPPAEAPPTRPGLSFTDWTAQTELFMELPALVQGLESPCAAHVTRLQPFSALGEGEVAVVLEGAGGRERFVASAPSVPGIFRPVAKPKAAGVFRLVVEVKGPNVTAEHQLGEVTVYATDAAARSAVPEEAAPSGRITFLKEQQWPIEFGTEAVSERPLRGAVRVSGQLRARADGEVLVVAPVAGRVAMRGQTFPRPGQRVTLDEPLGVLAPRLEAADLASLELAVTSSTLELRFAEREQARLQALEAEGAVPERRVQDAAHVVEEAQAALSTAQRRLEQFRRLDRSGGEGQGLVPVRSPLSGTVTAVEAAPGAFVEAGAPLFRVADLTQLWLEAKVPEIDVPKLTLLRGASVRVEGREEWLELGAERLVSRGAALDASRSLPVLFAVDNPGAQLVLGSACRVWLLVGEERAGLAVPEAAVVDDAGVMVVFVQVEGESFERRVVRLGARDRGYVEVLAGLRAGEHVVSRGAWSVKLASASGSVPAHGHSH